MANSRNMKLSIEDEAKVLDLTNELRFILNNVAECNDMWVSDLNTLRNLECKLEDVFEFEFCHKTYKYKLKDRTRRKKNV